MSSVQARVVYSRAMLMLLLFLQNSHAFTPNLPPKNGNPSTAMPATQTASSASSVPFYLNQPPRVPGEQLAIPSNDNSPKQVSDNDLMTVVPPSDTQMVELLDRLDVALKRPDVQFHFEQLILLENNSVRRINAGRYEVFIEDAGKDSTAFDWVLSNISLEDLSDMDTVGTAKQRILDYAKRQALAAGYENYKFHNFSILISYNQCPQQYPHIDLQHPNAQFALLVTDQSPGTVWFEPQHSIQSPRDLAQAWQAPGATSWIQAMENSPKCRSLLQRFGDVLSPTLTRFEPNQGKPLPSGTLLSLPGGIVHAGPASSKSRAVLFFSGHPLEATIRPYNPDVQYFASILLSDLVVAIWTQLTVPEREYLLHKLVVYLLEAEHKNMHMHLPAYTSMHQFCGQVETGEIGFEEDTNGEIEMDKHIRDFAKQEQLLL